MPPMCFTIYSPRPSTLALPISLFGTLIRGRPFLIHAFKPEGYVTPTGFPYPGLHSKTPSGGFNRSSLLRLTLLEGVSDVEFYPIEIVVVSGQP